MGISDRDYARATPPNSPQRRAGVGRMRVLSVNTWIIIINVVVFVLGMALVKYDPQTRRTEPILWQVSAGIFYTPEAAEDKEQQKRSIVDRSRVLPISEMPGYFRYPILDPKTPVVDPRTRRPVLKRATKPGCCCNSGARRPVLRRPSRCDAARRRRALCVKVQ